MGRRRGKAQARADQPRAGRAPGVAQAPRSTERPGASPSSGVPEDDERQALVVTHWFDSGTDGEPFSATVRLNGRRVGIRGAPKARDTFDQDEVVEGILPGTGRVSVTSWVYGIEPGEWIVNARLIRPSAHPSGRSSSEALPAAAWSWRRWSLSEVPATAVKTRWALIAPLARMPAVLPGSFTVLGILGIVLALVVQSAILSRQNGPAGAATMVFLLAVLSGLVGAKLWSRVLHPGEKLVGSGWAVDGFLVVAPIGGILTLIGLSLPIGQYLDAVAPGIFFAVAIGRVGCFFTGCCAGRCSRSRFAIWSSDRRIGARRLPTQLIEAAVGLVIGSVALMLTLGNVFAWQGTVFVAAFAAYFVARQFLLRIRAEPRKYLWQRSIKFVPKGA